MPRAAPQLPPAPFPPRGGAHWLAGVVSGFAVSLQSLATLLIKIYRMGSCGVEVKSPCSIVADSPHTPGGGAYTMGRQPSPNRPHSLQDNPRTTTAWGTPCSPTGSTLPLWGK